MKLARLKKNHNDFALFNLTLGQILSIRNSLQRISLSDDMSLSPIANDVYVSLNNLKLDYLSPEGLDLTDIKVKARND
jgi:hypothetical protein